MGEEKTALWINGNTMNKIVIMVALQMRPFPLLEESVSVRTDSI